MTSILNFACKIVLLTQQQWSEFENKDVPYFSTCFRKASLFSFVIPQNVILKHKMTLMKISRLKERIYKEVCVDLESQIRRRNIFVLLVFHVWNNHACSSFLFELLNCWDCCISLSQASGQTFPPCRPYRDVETRRACSRHTFCNKKEGDGNGNKRSFTCRLGALRMKETVWLPTNAVLNAKSYTLSWTRHGIASVLVQLEHPDDSIGLWVLWATSSSKLKYKIQSRKLWWFNVRQKLVTIKITQAHQQLSWSRVEIKFLARSTVSRKTIFFISILWKNA